MNTSNKFDEIEGLAARLIMGPILAAGLIGGVVGAVVALLLAPSSGEETRAAMRQKAIELQDRTAKTAKDTVSQAKSKAEEIKVNVLDKATEMKQRGQELMKE